MSDGTQVPDMMAGHSRKSTLVLCQSAFPDYRQAVLEILIERLGASFTVYAGSDHFSSSTTTNVRVDRGLRPLQNRYFLGAGLLVAVGRVTRSVSGGCGAARVQSTDFIRLGHPSSPPTP